MTVPFIVRRMTPSEVGERAEAALIDALVQRGHTVFLPLGGSSRVDLVFQDADGLHRVQVKNGVLRDGTVAFATCSNTNDTPKDYRDDADFIGVYCHDLRSAFLVPVVGLPLRGGRLRLSSTRNGQRHGIRWAEQFRLDWSPPVLDDNYSIEPPADAQGR